MLRPLNDRLLGRRSPWVCDYHHVLFLDGTEVAKYAAFLCLALFVRNVQRKSLAFFRK